MRLRKVENSELEMTHGKGWQSCKGRRQREREGVGGGSLVANCWRGCRRFGIEDDRRAGMRSLEFRGLSEAGESRQRSGKRSGLWAVA